MAEAQQAHRIRMEERGISSQLSQSNRGQAFGLMVGLCGIAAGTLTACFGHDIAGATIATAAIGTLAVAFLQGKSAQKRDLDAKKPTQS